MKHIRQKVALFLAVILLMPGKASLAANTLLQDTAKKQEVHNIVATPDNAPKSLKDEIKFNTGNHAISVVSREDFENGFGDASFEEDGSYTINIPEENPFFPYEVQFTYNGKILNEWFMSPDDTITVGGHVFHVSAYFDGTVVTQMSLEIAGDTVVVYPEKKEFTDEDGIMSLSLLPLKERKLTVDLTGYTPIELTRVSVNSIFTGEQVLKDTDKVVWNNYYIRGDNTYYNDEEFNISQSGGVLNLSFDTYHESNNWEMIVGDGSQLDAESIRYLINIKISSSKDWLMPTVYTVDSQGNRTEVETSLFENSIHYYDYSYSHLLINLKHLPKKKYIGLQINPSVFQNPKYDHLKVYAGNYTDPEKAMTEGIDITEQIFTENMEKDEAGYTFESNDFWITIISYNSSGKVTGCLPLEISMCYESVGLGSSDGGFAGIYDITNYERKRVCDVTDAIVFDGERDEMWVDYFFSFNQGASKINKEYYFSFNEEAPEVKAAFVGHYSTIEEAENAGAVDIKADLFNKSGGYKADYSKWFFFTIFYTNEKLFQGQDFINKFRVRIKEFEDNPKFDGAVSFDGLNDDKETDISCYVVKDKDDSYGEENNFQTILVDQDTDLTRIAPKFTISSGLNLYASGSNSPEISGISAHDFSNGPVQYTAVDKYDDYSQTFYLEVKKPEQGKGKLYINSLADEKANTKEEYGVVYSVREMFLDKRYGHSHDILIMNLGTEALKDLTVELVSDEVELDEYWTLNGNHALAGFSTIQKTTSHGELPNMAKIRIQPKEGADDGRDISGTLTIKSGNTILMILTLTGIVGDPSITTTEIPKAVKYVPYSIMLQNSNRYSWNTPNYWIKGGRLPKGIRIKPNGELYGVPEETGEFTFTVIMDNNGISSGSRYNTFSSSEKTFTLQVIENTDENIETLTDSGYELTQRVPNLTLDTSTDQTMVSKGDYEEFVNLFLDSIKLERGVDYTAEPGSTRITIKSQTLKRFNTPGSHTLAMEFRTKSTNTLRWAAQNYVVSGNGNSSGNNGNNGGNGNNSGSNIGGNGNNNGSNNSGNGSNNSSKLPNRGSRRPSNSQTAANSSQITHDPKKGYVHALTGIITGEGTGYSCWIQDETGWKLNYADRTLARGSIQQLEDGSTIEQILWELINGSWYAFGADGSLKDGWVYDYQLSSWYCTSIENGMKEGWYLDPQDRYTYYLEPKTGELAGGWKQINSQWYYFNATAASQAWKLDKTTGNWSYNTKSKEKPFGAMYKNEQTPDGYYVNGDGIWNGKIN